MQDQVLIAASRRQRAMQADEPQFTAADVTSLTGGVIDANTLVDWHYRVNWLTPTKKPGRSKHYLYSLAHLFEAKFRAELIGLGVSHKAARATLETILMGEAIARCRRDGRATSPAVVDDLPREMCALLDSSQPEAQRLWAIYFGRGLGARSPVYIRAIKDSVSVRRLLLQGASPYVLVLDVALIARDVIAYAKHRRI
jgi:hypothetical protein